MICTNLFPTLNRFCDNKGNIILHKTKKSFEPVNTGDSAMDTVVAYHKYLRALHPNWTEKKIIKKVKSHFNVQFV